MKNWKTIGLLLTATLVFGCAKKVVTKLPAGFTQPVLAPGGTATPDQTVLDGDWLTNCNPQGGTYLQTYLILWQNTWYRQINTYSDSECASIINQGNMNQGPFKISGTTTLSSGTVQKLDFTFPGTGGQANYLWYDIGQLGDNTLYLGDKSGSNDGSTAAKRPDTIDSNTPYLILQPN